MSSGTLRIRFLSRNVHKIREVTAILAPADVIASNVAIDELQTADTVKLVRDKCLQAFKKIGHPVFVEHTGLYISSLNDFPGGLTQVFWDTLGPERFCAIFGAQLNNRVVARTVIGYCDSSKIHQFEGSVRGTIPPSPRGPRDFQWDCAFLPDGYSETFAEMGELRKNTISMRRHALDAFSAYLNGNRHV